MIWKQKAVLTLQDVGTPIRAQEDARRMGWPEEMKEKPDSGKKAFLNHQVKTSEGEKVDVWSDIRHPDLFNQLRAWRNGEAERLERRLLALRPEWDHAEVERRLLTLRPDSRTLWKRRAFGLLKKARAVCSYFVPLPRIR